MRRLLLLVLSMVLVLPLSVGSLLAQDATPTAGGPFADLGLPTLDVTVTADAYEGIPDSLAAGRYLVTVSVNEDVGEYGGGVGFVSPAGMSGEEFIGFLGEISGPPDESGVGVAASTPFEGGVATPAADVGGMSLPDFIFQSHFAGGVYAMSGSTAQIVLDLTPGEWVAWGDDPAAPWQPVAFEVTGEMPTDLPEPESSATITMGEYVIKVTEGGLTSGTQLVRIDNIGAQPHFVTAGTTTVDITDADVEAMFESEMTGTPAALNFDPEADFEEGFFSGTQSTGTSVWLQIDVAPGNLLMACYFPDLSDGLPHAFHGMYAIVEIEG